jgi:hypothetical protein
MTRTTRLTTLVVTAVLVVGLSAPAAGAAGTGASDLGGSAGTASPVAAGTNNSSVNVTVGQQLSTVVAAASDEVQTDFEDTAFAVSFEAANESERAEAVADRAERLRERAENVSEAYRAATEAYRAGEISESEYAQRIAVLNARAGSISTSYRRLQNRAENVSALELRAEGFERTAPNRSVETLDAVTGGGPSAVLERFTGQTEGEIDIEAENGLSIEAQSEDGERSVEVRRGRDDDDSMTVAQSAALGTARDALPAAPDGGSWALTEGSVHAESGYYEFAFALRGANATGESEVRVDGSTGSVFRLEQDVEPGADGDLTDRDDGENDTEADDVLGLVVADGTPAPNATITVQAVSDGQPAANATVYLGDRRVGTTDGSGTVSLTLPADGATVTAVRGDREAELEFEFEDREDEVFRQLDVSGSVDNGTVTVSVSYNGSPVTGATVYADGDRVGTTAGDGTVRFAPEAGDDLEVEVVKGEFEAELTFAVSGDSLSLAEEPHEGDGDKVETEDEDEDEREDENEREDDKSDEDEKDDEDDAETTTEADDDDGEDDDESETTTEDDDEGTTTDDDG